LLFRLVQALGFLFVSPQRLPEIHLRCLSSGGFRLVHLPPPDSFCAFCIPLFPLLKPLLLRIRPVRGPFWFLGFACSIFFSGAPVNRVTQRTKISACFNRAQDAGSCSKSVIYDRFALFSHALRPHHRSLPFLRARRFPFSFPVSSNIVFHPHPSLIFFFGLVGSRVLPVSVFPADALYSGASSLA